MQADENSWCLRFFLLLTEKETGLKLPQFTLGLNLLAEQFPCGSHQQSDAEQHEQGRGGGGGLSPAQRQPGGPPHQRDPLAVLSALPAGGRRLHPGLLTHLPAVHGGECAGLPHRD